MKYLNLSIAIIAGLFSVGAFAAQKSCDDASSLARAEKAQTAVQQRLAQIESRYAVNGNGIGECPPIGTSPRRGQCGVNVFFVTDDGMNRFTRETGIFNGVTIDGELVPVCGEVVGEIHPQ